jgi:TonB-linked SusC/RagA family outer membrane protein
MTKVSLKLFFVCFLTSLWGTVVAQNRTVQGTVSDLNGGLPGVNIVLKGTATGVSSDMDGNYSIVIPGNDAVLVFSFLGYDTKEVVAGARSVIDVTLQEDTQALGEVVVIGYGSQRKNDLSMAVSTVKVDQAIKSRPSDLASVLQGQIPGLTVQVNGGDPLSGASYNIRGKGSRDHDGVLWVVDGVPGAPYNLEDVESITVLKDAASAAIYGAQVGASGVILITTKKAQAGKVKVDMNVSYGIKNVGKVPEVVTAEQYMQLWRDAVDASTSTYSLPIAADPQRYPYGAVTRTNWMDEILRTGQMQHYALSLSGGSETVKALASFSYDKNDGIMMNTWKENIGGKFDLDFQATKWLRFSERASVTYANGQGDVFNGSHQGVLINAVFYPRSATVYEYNEDGSPVLNENNQQVFGGTIPLYAVAQGVTGYGEIRNPVAELSRLNQNRPSANVYSTSSLEIKPLAGLTVKSDLTVGLMPSRFEAFYAKVPEYGRPNQENYREITSTWRYKYLWETVATYAQAFGEHHISAMAGYSYQYENNHDNTTKAFNFDKENSHYTVFPNATDWSKEKPTESIWEEDMESVFGRVGYSYGDRYFATASLRHDRSSKLHPDNRSGTFPAFSASWKISSEAFFNLPAVNLLKLRGGWGQIGNVNSVSRYSYNVALANTSYPAAMGKDLQGALYGIYQRSISNPDLTWETSEQTSFGLDATVLNNSLNLSVDYFHKITKDLVDDLIFPQTAGYSVNPKGNVGEVLNSGWEFSASYNRNFGDLSTNVYGNLSTVKNEVLDLGSWRDVYKHTNSVNGGSMQPLQSEAGQPWYSYHLIKTDGIFQSQTEIDNYTWTNPQGVTRLIQPNARPGDLKFVDYNDDGMINDADRQYMGSYLPQLTYSFGAGFEYKGFDFNFLFQGVGGVKIFNGFKMMGLTGRGQGSYMLADALNNWTYDHSSNIPRITLTGDPNGNFDKASDFLLEDGSYLRLKNVTIGYTLPQRLLQTAGMNGTSLRIYAGVENLLTISDYSGFDAEVGNRGLDAGTYPVARTFNLGVNLNF